MIGDSIINVRTGNITTAVLVSAAAAPWNSTAAAASSSKAIKNTQCAIYNEFIV